MGSSYATYMYLLHINVIYCIVKVIDGPKHNQTTLTFLDQQHTEVIYAYNFSTISSYSMFLEFIFFSVYFLLCFQNAFLSSQH